MVRTVFESIGAGEGSPFGLITGVEYWSDETGPTFLARDTYAWSDPVLDRKMQHVRRDLTYNTYHAIHSLKSAMDRLLIGEKQLQRLKEGIFFRNAKSLLGEARCDTALQYAESN